MSFTVYTRWRQSEFRPALRQAGRVECAACSPSDARRVLVGTETGGLFLSIDAANTFAHADSLLANRINDVAFLSDSTAVATGSAEHQMDDYGGVWLSHTAGNAWHHVPDAPGAWTRLADAYQIAHAAEIPLTCVGSNRGLLLSRDRFTNFTIGSLPIPPMADPRITAVCIPDPRPPGTILAAADSGIYRSVDGGANWVFIPLPAPITIKSPHALDGNSELVALTSDSGQIFVSQDGGFTWASMDRLPEVRFAAGGNVFVKVRYDGFDIQIYCSNRFHMFRKTLHRRAGQPFDTSGGWSELSADHVDTRCLAFDDRFRPYLLGTDGGLHRTDDGGGSWHFTAGSRGGLCALQVYDVTGQYNLERSQRDLYFGTQDNGVWASSDLGATWPHALEGEGFFMSGLRRVAHENESVITFQYGGYRMDRMRSGPLFRSVGGWSSPESTVRDDRSPECVGSTPGHYVQYAARGRFGPGLCRTVNYGTTWETMSIFADTPFGPAPPAVCDTEHRSTFYQAISGGAIGGLLRIALVKVVRDKRTGVCRRSYPRMQFVSPSGTRAMVGLGIRSTMLPWSAVFAVDPWDDRHLIAADVVNERVVRSTDGGDTWTEIAGLTERLRGPSLRFRGDQVPVVLAISLVHCISFFPDDPRFILIGTNGAGLWSSSDRGETWEYAGGRLVPKITSVYWVSWNQVIFSSYGRGLWRLHGDIRIGQRDKQGAMRPPTHSQPVTAPIQPTGIRVSHLFYSGHITGLTVKEGVIARIAVFPGTSHLLVTDGETDSSGLPQIEESAKATNYEGVDEQPVPPKPEWKAVGVEVSEDGQMSVIYAPQPLELTERKTAPDEELPKEDEESPYAKLPMIRLAPIEGDGARLSDHFAPGQTVLVMGMQFDRDAKDIEIMVDDIPVSAKPQWSDLSGFSATVQLPHDFGGHTLRAKQVTQQGLLEDVTYFSIVPVHLAKE